MVSDNTIFLRIFGRFEPGSLSTFFENRTSKNLKNRHIDSLHEAYCRVGDGMTPGLGGKIDILSPILFDRTKMPKSTF